MLELKGKGLFVFSDPGGAKPILAWIHLNRGNLKEIKIISDRTYSFYDSFGFEVNAPATNLTDDFAFKPDFVFTGTSYTSKIELKYIEKAKAVSIPVYSFIDHWTNIRKRFNYYGREIFPDYILLLDNRARQLAIEQGLDISKAIITGNPYYDWLQNWTPSITKETFMEQMGVKEPRNILLYAPDPLSNVNGMEEYGFDEVNATRALVNLFNTHHQQLKKWLVFVKPHPNQQIDKLENIISKYPSFVLLSKGVDTNTAIYYADVIAGFFSSILIEASVMRKPVFRFLDFAVKQDPIAELQIGNIVNSGNFVLNLQEIEPWN